MRDTFFMCANAPSADLQPIIAKSYDANYIHIWLSVWNFMMRSTACSPISVDVCHVFHACQCVHCCFTTWHSKILWCKQFPLLQDYQFGTWCTRSPVSIDVSDAFFISPHTLTWRYCRGFIHIQWLVVVYLACMKLIQNICSDGLSDEFKTLSCGLKKLGD